MPKIPFAVRGRILGTSAVVLTVGCLTALIGPVWSHGLDRNQVCVSNVKAISRGVAGYAEDYDEYLPPAAVFANITNFQQALGVYTGNNPAIFRCPSNGNAYYTPNAALGGNFIGSFPDPFTIEVIRDSKPHPDGELTVGFADGHAERGGIVQVQPDVDCSTNVQQISRALQAYIQDYDEQTPFQQDDTAFRQEVQPYTRTNRVWICPDTQKYYTIGEGFRGKPIASFPDLSPIIVVQDSVPHPSGVITTGYLDGYVEQVGPKGIIYPSLIPTPDTSVSNFRQLGTALLTYSQDYDERLPIYNNYGDLLQTLRPYLYDGNRSRIFQILNQPTYQANMLYSGIQLTSLDDVSNAIYLRDVYDFGDGLMTVGYLDGHVNRIPRPIKPQSPTTRPGTGNKTGGTSN